MIRFRYLPVFILPLFLCSALFGQENFLTQTSGALFLRNLNAAAGEKFKVEVLNPSNLYHRHEATGINLLEYSEDNLLQTALSLDTLGYVVYDLGMYGALKTTKNQGKDIIDKVKEAIETQHPGSKFILTAIWLDAGGNILDFDVHIKFEDGSRNPVVPLSDQELIRRGCANKMNAFQKNAPLSRVFDAEHEGLSFLMNALKGYAAGQVIETMTDDTPGFDQSQDQEQENVVDNDYFYSPAGLPLKLPKGTKVRFFGKSPNPATIPGALYGFTLDGIEYWAKHDGAGNFTGYGPPGQTVQEDGKYFRYAEPLIQPGSYLVLKGGFRVILPECDFNVITFSGVQAPSEPDPNLKAAGPIVTEPIVTDIGSTFLLDEQNGYRPTCMPDLSFVEFNSVLWAQYNPLGDDFGTLMQLNTGDRIYYNLALDGTPCYFRYNTTTGVWEAIEVPETDCTVCALGNLVETYLWEPVQEFLSFSHTTLDVVGAIPFAGELADFGNGVWYLVEGDGGNAALSFASMVPLVVGAAGKVVVAAGGALFAIKAIGYYDEVSGVFIFKNVDFTKQFRELGFTGEMVKNFVDDFSRKSVLLKALGKDEGLVEAWKIFYLSGRSEFTTDLPKLQVLSNILGNSNLQQQGFTASELINIAKAIGKTKTTNPSLAAYLDENLFSEIKFFGENILSESNTTFENMAPIIGMLKNAGADGASQKGGIFVLKSINETLEDFIGNRNIFEFEIPVSPDSPSGFGRIDLVSFNNATEYGKIIEFKSGENATTSSIFRREFLYRDLWTIPGFNEVSGNIFQWRISDVNPLQFKNNVKNWLESIANDGAIMQFNKNGERYLTMFEDHYYQFYNGSPPWGMGTPEDFVYAIRNYENWFNTWFNEIFKFPE